MKGSFRQSMAWLHTWSGLIVGWLLFAIFLTGTISFYRYEITQWMRPEVNHKTDASGAAGLVYERLKETATGARRWLIDLPDDRDPLAHVYIWRDPGVAPQFQREELDGSSGEPVVARSTYGGDFLFYFHFDLNLPSVWGRLIVGAAAIIMLVGIVSGVITHRRIFKDFFNFRPGKASHRSWLDAHNIMGVMALPFHIMITYTGLITLMFLYMPFGREAAYPDNQQAFLSEAALSRPIPEPARQAAPLTPLTPLIAEAVRRWDGRAVGRIDVYRPGDANAQIELTVSDATQITFHRGKVLFDGVTGELLSETENTRWAAETRGAMYGLHIGRFADPLVRFLYFVSSVVGTAVVATGLILWTAKRRPKPSDQTRPGFGYRLVDSLNVGTIAGLPIATAAFFWANRLLPADLGPRADIEALGFFAVWLLAYLHAAVRPTAQAWVEQLALAASLYALLPLLNALTTQSHLGYSLFQGDWVRAGFDLAMFATGLLLAWTTWHLQRKRKSVRAQMPSGAEAGVPLQTMRKLRG